MVYNFLFYLLLRMEEWRVGYQSECEKQYFFSLMVQMIGDSLKTKQAEGTSGYQVLIAIYL